VKRRTWPHPLSGSERRSAWPMHGWIAAVGILGLALLVLSL
jgi:hypothetical protein